MSGVRSGRTTPRWSPVPRWTRRSRTTRTSASARSAPAGSSPTSRTRRATVRHRFCLVFALPSWVRHGLCLVFALPSWVRHGLCLVRPLPSQLSQRLSLRCLRFPERARRLRTQRGLDFCDANRPLRVSVCLCAFVCVCERVCVGAGRGDDESHCLSLRFRCLPKTYAFARGAAATRSTKATTSRAGGPRRPTSVRHRLGFVFPPPSRLGQCLIFCGLPQASSGLGRPLWPPGRRAMRRRTWTSGG